MLRPARLAKIYCTFPKSHLDAVISKLQYLGLIHFFGIRRNAYQNLKPIAIDAEKFLLLSNRINKLIYDIEKGSGWSVFRTYLGLPTFHLKISEGLGKDCKKLKRHVLALEEKYKNPELSRDSIYKELLVLREQVDDLIVRLNTLKLFGQTHYTISFGGWVPKAQIEKIKTAIETATKKTCIIEIKEPLPDENVPVLLENPSAIKQFEIIPESYGMPAYNDINPVPIIAISFTLLFGLMFADIGYGIALTALNLLLFFATRKTKTFIRNFNIILIYAGVASASFGFMFGEFFGFKLIEPMFDPLKDIFTLLTFSAVIGSLHITISIVSRLISDTLNRKLPLYPLSLLAIIFSSILFLYFRKEYLLYSLLSGLVLLVAAKKFDAIMEVTSLVSNVFSYLRLGVIGIAHILISRLLASMLLMFPPNIFGLLVGGMIFAFSTLFVLLLSIILVSIQTMRLQWLEYFTRAYSKVGKKFDPLKYNREFIYPLK